MKKFAAWSQALFIFILAAGIYGAVHNQVSFSASPEYFTEFKYKQFKIDPGQLGSDRVVASLIGFLASWWMGLIAGLLLASTALLFPAEKFKKLLTQAGWLLVSLTFLGGCAGFLLSFAFGSAKSPLFYIPSTVKNPEAFINAGFMHDGSYVGAAMGILIAEIWLIYRYQKFKRDTSIHHL